MFVLRTVKKSACEGGERREGIRVKLFMLMKLFLKVASIDIATSFVSSDKISFMSMKLVLT